MDRAAHSLASDHTNAKHSMQVLTAQMGTDSWILDDSCVAVDKLS